MDIQDLFTETADGSDTVGDRQRTERREWRSVRTGLSWGMVFEGRLRPISHIL